MVGLRIVLESQKWGGGSINKKHPQVINKTTMNIMSTRKSLNPSTLNSPPYTISYFPFMGSSFLEQCFFCAQKLLPGRDIYMYKGDRAFCSVECRCKQISMDEEDILKKGNNNCSLATCSSSRSSSGASCCRKATRNRVGAFAN